MTEPVGIEEAQQAIIDEFGQLSDWQDRYRKIIKVAMPAIYVRKQNSIPGKHISDSTGISPAQSR